MNLGTLIYSHLKLNCGGKLLDIILSVEVTL